MSAKPGISLLIQNTNEKDNKCCSINYKHNNLVRDFILVKLEIKDHLSSSGWIFIINLYNILWQFYLFIIKNIYDSVSYTIFFIFNEKIYFQFINSNRYNGTVIFILISELYV